MTKLTYSHKSFHVYEALCWFEVNLYYLALSELLLSELTCVGVILKHFEYFVGDTGNKYLNKTSIYSAFSPITLKPQTFTLVAFASVSGSDTLFFE